MRSVFTEVLAAFAGMGEGKGQGKDIVVAVPPKPGFPAYTPGARPLVPEQPAEPPPAKARPVVAKDETPAAEDPAQEEVAAETVGVEPAEG